MRNRQSSLILMSIICVLGLLLAGCGDDNSPVASEGVDSDQSEGSNSATQVVANISQLLVGVKSLEHLAWGSIAIVHGRVGEVFPSERYPAEDGPLGTATPQDFYDARVHTDYRIDVIGTYRGPASESVIVRQSVGTIDNYTLVNDAAIDLKVGDEAVLFLIPDLQGGDWLFFYGGRQG